MQRSLQPPQASGGIIPATCFGSGDWGPWVLPRGRVRDPVRGSRGARVPSVVGRDAVAFPPALSLLLSLLFVYFSLSSSLSP